MDGIIVDVDGNGFNRIIDIIRTLPEKKRYQIQRMLQRSADRILTVAQATVPEDTGALKQSGHVMPQVEDEDTIMFDVVFGDGDGTATQYDYDNDHIADGYAWFTELGTQNMAPQPYLGPAFEEEAQKLVQRLGNMFNEDDEANA